MKFAFNFNLRRYTEGYAPGVISLIVRTLLTKRRVEKLARFPLTCREVLNVTAKFGKVDPEAGAYTRPRFSST